MCMSDFG